MEFCLLTYSQLEKKRDEKGDVIFDYKRPSPEELRKIRYTYVFHHYDVEKQRHIPYFSLFSSWVNGWERRNWIRTFVRFIYTVARTGWSTGIYISTTATNSWLCLLNFLRKCLKNVHSP